MAVAAVRYSERPDLWSRTEGLESEVWPEYNLHGEVLGHYWGQLGATFPEFQLVLFDDHRDEVLARGHSVPCLWDGTVAGLGPGIDAMITAAFADHAAGRPANTLSALSVEIPPRHQGRGLSRTMLEAMVGLARAAGFGHLVAPVRPSAKERYPLAPIERYVNWKRADGQAFDPWLRVHLRMGGTVWRPVPHSMRIIATVADWESWTQMEFPETGEYVFPRGLATLQVDREADRGFYWEPNVWVVHAVGGDQPG